MASLTIVATNSRRAIRYSIYFVIFLIVARITWGIGTTAYRIFFPEPPPPPTMAFGKLPVLPFPVKDSPSFEYTIETVEGGLPVLPEQSTIYFMPNAFANLLSLEAAKETAALLGFSSDPQQVTETIYRFPHLRADSTFEINIITGVFSVSYDFTRDPSPLSAIPPSQEESTELVVNFLGRASLFPSDFIEGAIHEFLKVEGSSLVGAISLSEANLVKVNFFRQDYNSLPSLTSGPNEANTWFIVSGSRRQETQIIAGQYRYLPIDEEQTATYPLRTAEEAFAQLTEGNAYFADTGLNEGTVTIRRVYLAYYDPGVYTEFYQPIVVFEGDNGFIAYVPAVSSDYYGE